VPAAHGGHQRRHHLRRIPSPGVDGSRRPCAGAEACEIGGTSVHSTGSSPGFITEAVPLVLTSIQRQLTALAIDEYADLSQRNSPELCSI
jgi:hypothetical protein